VVQPDVAHLVAEDDPQTVPVVLIQVDEQLIRQHDVVVAGGLRGERIQRPVAVGQEDVRPPPQPQLLGEILGRAVQLGVLVRRQLDRGAPDACALGLPDHDQPGDQQQQGDQGGPDGGCHTGVLQSLRQEGHDHGGAEDERDDSDVQHDHENEERDLCGVPKSPCGRPVGHR
jgi:hypothetical protein